MSLTENRIETIDREIERLQAQKKKLQDQEAERKSRTEEISEEEVKSFAQKVVG